MIISEKLKEWRCRIFHKKQYSQFIHWPIVPTLISLYGCKKCDLWLELTSQQSEELKVIE